MMYLRPFAALCCAVTLTPGMTVAQEVGDSRLSLGASSFGATAEYAYRFHSNFSVRGVAGGLVDVSPDIDLDGTPYEADFSPNGAGILLDWHTGLGGLRVSGGAAYSTSSFSGQAIATATNPVTIGTTTLSSGETVDATVNFANEFAPVVTIGYDQKLGDTWVLSGEIGAVFNGGYDADVSVSGGLVDSIPPSANDLLQEAAAIGDDYLNSIKAYPYISIMIGAKF